jgi:hypothetical protein
MNTNLNFRRDKNRSAKSARRSSFKLAAALASLCIGAGLLLPVVKNHGGNRHAMPPGQFRADMRTLAAAVSYLLGPDPVVEQHPLFATGIYEGFTDLSPGRTHEMPGPLSRQTETTISSSTNPPAPI